MANFNPERARQYRINIETILKQFGEAHKGKYRPHEVRISHKLTTLCNNLRFDQSTYVFSAENQALYPQRANMSQNDRIQDSAQKLVNAVDQEIEAAQDQGASSCFTLFAGKPKERIVDCLMKAVLPVVFPRNFESATALAFRDASASPVAECLRSPSLLDTL